MNAAKTRALVPVHGQKGISLAQSGSQIVTGTITTQIAERELRMACPHLYQDLDAREEILARFDDALCHSTNETSAQVLDRVLRYASTRREPCYNLTAPRYGVCQDPIACVVPRHARNCRWEGQRYVPAWLRTMAEKIDQHPTSSGANRQWQIIVLSTGPTTAEQGQSNEAMVACARCFSRLHGFRWDHLFCWTDPRRKADRRIIKSPRDEYLLEARVELVPYRTVAATLPYRRSRDSKRKPIPVHTVWQPPEAQPTWGIRWVFAYYGEPLGQDTSSRLRARWLRHKRNRGRSGVICSFEPVQNHAQALNRMQLYRIACLESPGAARVKLARLRYDSGLKRVFRLGASRRQLKTAKRLWKEALEITDQQMFASPVSQEKWAEAIVGAGNWRQAMSRLPGEANRPSRQWAHDYRWTQRREVVYPELLRQELLAERATLSPLAFVTESANECEEGALREQLSQILASQKRMQQIMVEQVAEVRAVRSRIDQLSRDLKAGRITRAEFDHRRKKLEQGPLQWPPAPASVQ